MITRRVLMDYLDRNKIDYWFAKSEFPFLVSASDGLVVRLVPDAGNGNRGGRMMVTNFGRYDNRVRVKYLGTEDLWSVDELATMLQERGYRL